uniref:Uncharacterized protein n=1 Tax=Meloidogyne hapla TaxID=6305 RepID=A0A1I8BBI9_MELHA
MPLEKRRNALSFNSINNIPFQINNKLTELSDEILSNVQKTNNNLIDSQQSEEEFPTLSNPSTSGKFGFTSLQCCLPNNFNYSNNFNEKTFCPPFPLMPTESIANLQKSLKTKKVIGQMPPQILKISLPDNSSSSLPSFSYQNLPSSSSGFQIEEKTLIQQKNYLFNYKKENFNQDKIIIEAILTSPQALVISGLLSSNILENYQFWDQWLCRLATSLNTTQWQIFWRLYANIFGFKALPGHLLKFFENSSFNEFNEKEKCIVVDNNLFSFRQQPTINLNNKESLNYFHSSIDIKFEEELNGYICGILCNISSQEFDRLLQSAAIDDHASVFFSLTGDYKELKWLGRESICGNGNTPNKYIQQNNRKRNKKYFSRRSSTFGRFLTTYITLV